MVSGHVEWKSESEPRPSYGCGNHFGNNRSPLRRLLKQNVRSLATSWWRDLEPPCSKEMVISGNRKSGIAKSLGLTEINAYSKYGGDALCVSS